MNRLIVNADDFGYSEGINRGIIEAHAQGIVTSTSLMVGAVAAKEAAGLSDYPELSVGLHLVLAGSPNIQMTEAEIERELQIQLAQFQAITGKEPTHIDTHKIEPSTNPGVREVLAEFGRRSKTPVRGLGYAKFIKSFFGLSVDGSGQPNAANVSVEALKKSIDEATAEFNEIMCHAGYSDDYLRSHSSYNDLRETELRSLSDPSVKKYIDERGLQLCGWSAVKSAMSSDSLRTLL